MNHDTPDKPDGGIEPEDWPFSEEMPNIFSFDEILGEQGRHHLRHDNEPDTTPATDPAT